MSAPAPQSRRQPWGKALLALVCFGPPLAFFSWVAWRWGISRGDDTPAKIPFTAAAGMAIVLLLSRWVQRNPDASTRSVIAKLLVLSALAMAIVTLVWLIIWSLGWWAILSIVGIVGAAAAVWFYAHRAATKER